MSDQLLNSYSQEEIVTFLSQWKLYNIIKLRDVVKELDAMLIGLHLPPPLETDEGGWISENLSKRLERQ